MLFIAHGACIEVEIVMASWGSFMGHNVDASRMPNRSLRASVACCHLSQDETHFCSRPDLSSEFTPPNFRVCAWWRVPVKHFKICHILCIQKSKVAFSIFHFVLLYISPNECPGLCRHRPGQILNRFVGTFCWAQTLKLGGVSWRWSKISGTCGNTTKHRLSQ